MGHVAISLYRSMAGLILGAGAGVLLGLMSGVSRRVAGFFDPIISLSNPVPKVAILPVLIVWFGISDTSKIVLIAITTFFPAYLSALAGVRQVQTPWVWAARSMGARPAQVFRKVVFPAALPQILGGLRVALALAFILMFASEAVGTAHRAGLGFLVIVAEAGGRWDLMLSAITVIGILGFTADRLLLVASRSVLRGRETSRG
ncbi:MAG TPA: ABC transporter permease [Candidatus Limnocylindria bacterium]|nr:ABC transporter permease [Candidatus Limnocylindria bacterium]